MRIHLEWSTLSRTKWYEYSVRFIFGGGITAITGVLAKHYGPGFAGLFLAFPAIFPAQATLIERHERDKKAQAGVPAQNRARLAAALDARGAAMGSFGLACFALMTWQLGPITNGGLVPLGALGAWASVAVLTWSLRKKLRSHA